MYFHDLKSKLKIKNCNSIFYISSCSNVDVYSYLQVMSIFNMSVWDILLNVKQTVIYCCHWYLFLSGYILPKSCTREKFSLI